MISLHASALIGRSSPAAGVPVQWGKVSRGALELVQVVGKHCTDPAQLALLLDACKLKVIVRV